MTDFLIELAVILPVVAFGIYMFRHYFYKENRWQLKVIVLQLIVGLSAGYAFLFLFEDAIRNGVRSTFSFFGG